MVEPRLLNRTGTQGKLMTVIAGHVEFVDYEAKDPTVYFAGGVEHVSIVGSNQKPPLDDDGYDTTLAILLPEITPQITAANRPAWNARNLTDYVTEDEDVDASISALFAQTQEGVNHNYTCTIGDEGINAIFRALSQRLETDPGDHPAEMLLSGVQLALARLGRRNREQDLTSYLLGTVRRFIDHYKSESWIDLSDEKKAEIVFEFLDRMPHGKNPDGYNPSEVPDWMQGLSDFHVHVSLEQRMLRRAEEIRPRR